MKHAQYNCPPATTFGAGALPAHHQAMKDQRFSAFLLWTTSFHLANRFYHSLPCIPVALFSLAVMILCGGCGSEPLADEQESRFTAMEGQVLNRVTREGIAAIKIRLTDCERGFIGGGKLPGHHRRL